MRKILYTILALFLTVALSAQFTDRPGKIQLGYQTTANGLVCLVDSIPAFTPSDQNDCFLAQDTVANKIYIYKPSLASWEEFPSGIALIDSIENVLITSPANGQVLRYDGTKWINSTERDTSDTNEIQYLVFSGDTLGLTDDPTSVILPYLEESEISSIISDSISLIIIDSTRLTQDSILVYFQDGIEIGRDTLSLATPETDPIYSADEASLKADIAANATLTLQQATDNGNSTTNNIFMTGLSNGSAHDEILTRDAVTGEVGERTVASLTTTINSANTLQSVTDNADTTTNPVEAYSFRNGAGKSITTSISHGGRKSNPVGNNGLGQSARAWIDTVYTTEGIPVPAGSAKYAGGVFDGESIWFVPRNSPNALKVNPADGSYEEIAVPTGNNKYFGGVFDGESIWFVPYDATNALKINPADGSYEEIPVPAGSAKYIGGVFDGESIWFVPYDATNALKINPADGSYEEIAVPTGSVKYHGGVFDGESIWFVPRNATNALKINPADGSYEGIAVPTGSAKYVGGVFDGESIWFVPLQATNALKINPADGSYEEIDVPAGSIKYHGGVFDGESIWFVPRNATNALKVNPADGSYEEIAVPTGSAKYHGGVFDGESIWFVPSNATNALKVRPPEIGRPSFFTSGKLNVGGNAYFADNVGIGTTTPDAEFEVVGEAIIPTFSGETTFQDRLFLETIDQDNTNTSLLAADPVTGEVEERTVASLFSTKIESARNYSATTSGTGSVTVSHSLGVIPSVTVTNASATPYLISINSVTTTNFTIFFYDTSGSTVNSTAVNFDYQLIIP